MQEKEVMKAKRFNYIAFGVLCACVIAAVGLVIWLCSWPIDPSLETKQLEKMTASSYLALVGDICYELENAEALAELCGFDTWSLLEDAQAGEHILTIKLADEYELAFYEGGFARAYYGYSGKYHLDTAWYAVPEETAAFAAEYIRANGTVRELYLGGSGWCELDE